MTRLSDRDRRRLGAGGQRLQQERHSSELFERNGEALDRSTAGGMATHVRPIWSKGMNLSDAQRAVGNHFGACFESVNSAGGAEFLREHVDGGSAGGGGYNERAIEMTSKVRVAADSMKLMPLVTYPVGTSRSGAKAGRHTPIRHGSLVILICVEGLSLYQVGWMHGWTSTQGGKVVVPDRQKKRISAAFGDALDAISDGWAEVGLRVPASNVTVK